MKLLFLLLVKNTIFTIDNIQLMRMINKAVYDKLKKDCSPSQDKYNIMRACFP